MDEDAPLSDEFIAGMKPAGGFPKPNLSDEEIIERMDAAVYGASPIVHESAPYLAKVLFAAIRAYEEAKGE